MTKHLKYGNLITMRRNQFMYIFKKLRLKNKLSIRELANHLGCSHVWLMKLERERVEPSRSLLLRVASYFDIDAVRLFSQYEKPLPSIKEVRQEEIRNRLCEILEGKGFFNTKKYNGLDELVAWMREQFNEPQVNRLIKLAHQRSPSKTAKVYMTKDLGLEEGYSLEGLLKVAKKISKKRYNLPLRLGKVKISNSVRPRRPKTPQRRKRTSKSKMSSESEGDSDGESGDNLAPKIRNPKGRCKVILQRPFSF